MRNIKKIVVLLASMVWEPAPERPKSCVSLKNVPRFLLVHRSLLALVGRKQTLVRDQFSHQNPPRFMPFILTHLG